MVGGHNLQIKYSLVLDHFAPFNSDIQQYSATFGHYVTISITLPINKFLYDTLLSAGTLHTISMQMIKTGTDSHQN